MRVLVLWSPHHKVYSVLLAKASPTLSNDSGEVPLAVQMKGLRLFRAYMLLHRSLGVRWAHHYPFQSEPSEAVRAEVPLADHFRHPAGSTCPSATPSHTTMPWKAYRIGHCMNKKEDADQAHFRNPLQGSRSCLAIRSQATTAIRRKSACDIQMELHFML